MRIPRWILVSLIAVSAVALLAVPAWLWVQMPRWTAERFVGAIEAGDLDRANRLLTDTLLQSDHSWPYKSRSRTLNVWHMNVAIGGRGLREMIAGKQPVIFNLPDGSECLVTYVATWRQVRADWSELDARRAAIISAESQAQQAVKQQAAAALQQQGVPTPLAGAGQ